MDAYFNLPDFYIGRGIYTDLLNWQYQYPEIFLPNTKISAIFGMFPNVIWNGGGMVFGTTLYKKDIEDFFNFYNYELHIPLRLTFTNPLITPEMCHDTYSNLIAECGHNGMNEILVSSPVLENYLRSKYPNYKYCRSIIGAREEPLVLDPKYHMEVLRRSCNNDWDYLEKIPMVERPKIEILCTDPCPDDCPRLYSHYRDFGRAQIEFNPTSDVCQCSQFDVKGDFPLHYMKHNCKTFISRAAIDAEYLPRGYNQFKISGRGSLGAMMGGILPYLIQPEYHSDLIQRWIR